MVTVAVQAGGHSSRFGKEKAFVPLAGRPLIEHVLQRVKGVGDEVLITTNRPEAYAHLGLRLVEDVMPGAGPLGGLHAALRAAVGDVVLVIASDMPFVEPGLLRHMLELAPGAQVVIPQRGEYFEPLQAVYHRSCLPAVERALQAGELRMVSFFHEVRVLSVEGEMLDNLDPRRLSFFNINTPHDLSKAEALLHEG
jgi:molybdopterin-guanine dinucleotide biosynthesis protein A